MKDDKSKAKEKGEDEIKDRKEKSKDDDKKSEPTYEMLSNPARVIKPQLKVISMPENSRYRALKELSIGGIVIVRDTKKGEPEELVQPVAAGGPKVDEEKEPEPPEPFEYVEN